HADVRNAILIIDLSHRRKTEVGVKSLQALASCQRHWPQKSIYLGAQAHLQAFYAHFGFTPVTEVYDEDGIPHIGMARESRAV
ncbi:GNAT family N-acetyltransferase, partial [Klebsiella quasipneumoniae]|uniref:GNAT family N-acetyltransferase n=1 Tax=Klebsiella quasipneumoniae TaxID=1463165 RepID=UPI003A7F7218